MNEKTQELALLLEEWYENNNSDEPCRIDHKGFCQTHYDTPPCLAVRTREALGLDA